MHPTQNPPMIVLVDEVALYTGDTIWVDITPADALHCAAVYIDLHGFCKRDFYSSRLPLTPAACTTGAIGMAVHGHTTDNPMSRELPGLWHFNAAVSVLACYLVEIGQIDDDDFFDEAICDVEQIGDWNDHPSRTDAEVIAALNAAADKHNLLAGGAR
jgi:hypothetical protein